MERKKHRPRKRRLRRTETWSSRSSSIHNQELLEGHFIKLREYARVVDKSVGLEGPVRRDADKALEELQDVSKKVLQSFQLECAPLELELRAAIEETPGLLSAARHSNA